MRPTVVKIMLFSTRSSNSFSNEDSIGAFMPFVLCKWLGILAQELKAREGRELLKRFSYGLTDGSNRTFNYTT